MAIAGMILGIIALLFSFIPVIGMFVAIPCIAVGLPLSIAGLVQNQRRQQGIGMAIAGIVTGAIAAIMVVVVLVVIGMFVNRAADELEDLSSTLSAINADILDANIMGSAIRIDVDEPTEGNIEHGFDADYFVIAAQEGRMYRADVALGTLTDSLLSLYDSSGTLIASNDDYGESLASRVEWTASYSGNVFVKVEHALFDADSGTYTLTVTEQ